MFRAVVLFCAVLALTKGQATQVSQCTHGRPGPLPIFTVLYGCSTQPCLLPQGQDAVIDIVFQAPYAMQKMSTVAFGFLSITSFPLNLGEKTETCNFLSNTSCPVEQGQLIVYTLRVPIEEFIPVGTQLPIEIRIRDDHNVAVACFRMAVRIIPPAYNKLGVLNETMTVET